MKSVFTKKKKLEIPLPQGWQDVPFDVGFRVKTKPMNDIELLSSVSGVDVSDLRKSTDLETIHHLTKSLLFLNDWPQNETPEFPREVKGKPLPYVNKKDKFDLGGCEVGQVEDMKALIQETVNDNLTDWDIINIYPKFCGIYLQPILQGKEYDYESAMYYSKQLRKELDFKTVVNMGAFFLWRLSDLVNGSQNDKPKLSTLLRKLRPGLKTWGRLLAFMLPLIALVTTLVYLIMRLLR